MDISFRATSRGVALLLLMAACSSPASKTPCPRHEAAFRVQLAAPGAPIPADTAIQVTYQGSETETFSLGRVQHNQDVCCRLGSQTSGALPSVPCMSHPLTVDAGSRRDAAAAPRPDAARDASEGGVQGPAVGPGEGLALLCELWTNGPASVHVTASGYATIDRDLSSKLRDDNCGVRTIDVRLTLIRPDGGAP